MNAEETKQRLRDIFGQYIIFNKDFDTYAAEFKETMQQTFLLWCQAVKDNEVLPLKSKTKKSVVVFLKKIGSTNRCIVLKIVNGEFKEVHLADHDYYNTLMHNLGLKKSSKQY